MKKLLLVIVLTLLAWASTVWVSWPAALDIWWLRREALNLSGILSFELMGLIMVLAVRPVWLEQAFGGLDRMYRVHKWAGILAISFGILHYGIKLSGGLLKHFFERPPRVAHAQLWFDFLRSPVKDMGEWSVYLLAIMLVLTLWQRFPYSFWRYLHKALAVVFVVLSLHALVLSPQTYWAQPMGWLIAATAAVGSICALISLFGQIGRQRTHQAIVTAIEHTGKDVLELECKTDGKWKHQAGQFAFLRFNGWEGAHPFTIASAANAQKTLRFSIKALGDYTHRLPYSVKVGDVVSIEGPYGCFTRANDARQVWIAAGIGITPFLAWLDEMKDSPDQAPSVTLHYCVRNEQEAIYSQELAALCANLPSINLHIHQSERDGRASMQSLHLGSNTENWPSVWFCGPQAFASHLFAELRKAGMPKHHFHQEAFQLR
ncbi:ferric reductase-like transmembrane domain-containing protein [Chitinibacter fontanus]|uniref:Ferric reductase-like transmembrane domain-containing protein n=1 Tax=Chitinibacter fontanus TaxID=1737446 RepID=A0A7D5VAX2_9NEIS|nr:ferric reductase-like transmembrane domain-containing protein [Chitinibacter fontanus]QLI82531.1 ferric reductase-like transmembrane domain-containing protein [Chitinibacter fontanus]